MEKSSAAPTRPCFEACRLGTGFRPAALALGTFGVYNMIMWWAFRHVKQNLAQSQRLTHGQAACLDPTGPRR
jgi:hypothetical protein